MSPDTRAHVHALVDQLPPVQLAALETLLESIVDDEELTAADRAAIKIGLDSLGNNRGVPMEEVLGDFGLTMSDFDKMANER
jgi:hypothetical protein